MSNVHDKAVSSLFEQQVNVQPVSVPKALQKVLLYKYLTSNKDKALIEKLTSPSLDQRTSLHYNLLTKHLFMATDLLSKADVNHVQLSNLVKTLSDTTNPNTFKLSQLKRGLNALELDYLLFNKKSSLPSQHNDEFCR